MTTISTEAVDISSAILHLTRCANGLRHLIADETFGGWRHEQEPGSLLQSVLTARGRAEDLRFVEPATQARRLRLLLNGLPLDRLDQLLGEDADEAAASRLWRPTSAGALPRFPKRSLVDFPRDVPAVVALDAALEGE